MSLAEKLAEISAAGAKRISEETRAIIGAATKAQRESGILAGSPCPVEVMKQVIDRMHMDQVTIAYCMTETSPVSTQTSVDDPLDRRVGTVGRIHRMCR